MPTSSFTHAQVALWGAEGICPTRTQHGRGELGAAGRADRDELHELQRGRACPSGAGAGSGGQLPKHEITELADSLRLVVRLPSSVTSMAQLGVEVSPTAVRCWY